MKNKWLKKMVLTLAFAVAIATALTGCGRPTEASSTFTASQNSGAGSVTSSSRSEDNADVSPSEEEPEDTAPAISEEEDAISDRNDVARATGSSAPDGADPDDAIEPDVGAAAPTPEERQTSAPESGGLSGIDLNVWFGDDGAPFVLHLYDNETAAAIARHVGTADWRLPIYTYDGYENWEVMQYYDIPSRYEIPSNPQSVSSEKAGTVYYSEPNRIVLFYGDANVSSEYTPVGYIDYSQEFVDAVENNPVLEGWGNKIVRISR